MKSLNGTIISDGKNCSFCNVLIEKDEIIKSHETYVRLLKSVQSAAHPTGGNRAVFIFGQVFLIMFVLFAMGSGAKFFARMVFLYSTAQLVFGYWAVQKWLDEYAYLSIDDEEFIAAKKQIKNSRLMWVTATIINLILWFLYIKLL